MPHLHNGIGTWYFGKHGLTNRQGSCQKCHHFATLSSYDTTLFFTLLYIPLIPLKKFRVLDDCSACRRHARMPLKKWKEVSTKAIGEAVVAVEQKPGDAGAAINAIGVAMEMRDEPTFVGLTAVIEPAAGKNHDVWVALGDGYNFFGHREAAIAAFERALEIKPDEQVSRALGVSLIRRGRVDEGWGMLEGRLERREEGSAGQGLLAAMGYQSLGRHAEALDVLERVEQADTSKETLKEVKRLRKISQKNQSAGKPVSSALIQTGTEPDSGVVGTAKSERTRAWLVAPILGVLFIGVWLVVATVMGRSVSVHIVNGLSRPYKVKVGSREVSLVPYGHAVVRMPEGTVSVEVTDTNVRIPVQTCTLHSSFLMRPVRQGIYIINPDQMAALFWEKVEYLPLNSTSTAQHEEQVRKPALLHHEESTDYAFAPFPASLQIKSSASKFRTRIDLAPLDRPELVARYLAQKLNEHDVREYLMRGMSSEPTIDIFPAILTSRETPEAARALLRPLLAERPVNYAAHRIYQQMLQQQGSPQAAEEEYRGLLKAEPDNPGLQYLLGRLVSREEAKDLWMRVKAAGDPDAASYALVALAFDQLTTGDFAGALESLEAVPPKCKLTLRFERLMEDVLHAVGRFQACQQLPSLAHELTDLAPEQMMAVVYYVQRERNSADAARSLVIQYLGDQASANPKSEPGRFRDWCLAQIAYAEGDIRPLQSLPPRPDTQDLNYWIVKGDLGEAVKMLEGPEGQGAGYEHLLVGLAAHMEGRQELAQTEWESARVNLSKRTKEDRTLAAWIGGTAEPAAGEAAALGLPLDQKRLALAVVAIKYPARREEALGLLEKLNFDRRPPHLLLKRVAEGK